MGMMGTVMGTVVVVVVIIIDQGELVSRCVIPEVVVAGGNEN